jgi:pimeloyl-ACP methyl ester carboxylesterase
VAPQADGSPIVLLPGSLCRVETLEPAAAFLARRRETIAWSPPRHALEPELVADELERLLASRSRTRAHLVGFSLGAQVARNTAAIKPALAASVVLVGAGAPDEARGRGLARALPLLRLLPASLWRRRFLAEQTSALRGDDPAVAAARLRTTALIAALSRDDLVAARERLLATDRAAIGDHPVPPPIPVLRIDFGNDEVIPGRERSRLSKLEPRAVVETLPGLGHGAVLTQPPRLLERIARWCDEVEGASSG